MAIKFTNNASSKLIQALTADATSMHIKAEDVAKFPVLGAEDYCLLTLVGDNGNHEIVKVTNISSDGVCTIERAQDSTTAKEWPIENKVELRITAEYLNSITTSEDVLSLVSPIEEDISNIKNNITDVENDILNIENKHASDIEAVNSSITSVQEDIENNISVSISNLEQSIADTSSSLTDLITSVEEGAAEAYVKKTGDTMTGSLNIKASHPIITESSTSITKGTTPAENVTSQIKYTDKDGNLTGAVINTYLSEGSIKSALIAVDPSSDNTSELAIKWKDGAACGYAPSPAIDATSSEITTASWVNTKLSKYLPLTGGTVTGAINFSYPGTATYAGRISAYNDSDGKRLLIDTYEDGDKGAFLALIKGSDTKNPGGFTLTARDKDGSIYRQLTGYINGDLRWNNKRIVRSVGGELADINGNVNAPYLPIAGGTMTGPIFFNNTALSIYGDGIEGFFIDSGTGGGHVALRPESSSDPTAGAVYIGSKMAGSADLIHHIMVSRYGCIADGKHIVRSVNGMIADANGNVNIDVQNAADIWIGTGSGGFTMPWHGMVSGYVAGGNGQEFRFYRNGNQGFYAKNPEQGYGTIRMPFAFFAASGESVACSNNAWYDVRITRF